MVTPYVKSIGDGISATYYGKGQPYVVETPSGSIYYFYIDGTSSDPGYKKSTDRGKTFGAFVALKNTTATAISVWADWWSGITATSYIHVVYTESVTDDTFYRYIDTANSDTLGTERTVFAGSSTAAGGSLSITRARGGNLVCATCIDAGAEYDTVKSTDLFVNKTSIAEIFEGETGDTVLMMPGWAADNQDVMGFFWDASADEISVKFYDDSGDAWSETVLGTSMVEAAANLQYSAAVDLLDSKNVLIAWSAVDTANADLRCWEVTEAAQTEVTNVVLNSTDDQAYCAISINSTTGIWYAFYCGKSDGSETALTILTINYKISADNGNTWSGETEYDGSIHYNTLCLFCCPVNYGFPYVWRMTQSDTKYPINAYLPQITPRASYQLGM